MNTPDNGVSDSTQPQLMFVGDPSSIAHGVLPDPVGPADLHQWVDMLADADVDTYVQDVYNQGFTVYWRSDRFQYDQREQHRRFLNMLDAGTQPLHTLLDRTHERGMLFLAGFRMNDTHDFPEYADFIESHPQWHLKVELSHGGKPLDFSFDEVRDFIFEVMQEVVDRFDVDGLEMTFRDPAYFSAPHGGRRAQLMTALVGRIRTMLDAYGRSRGRKLLLGARVNASLDQCQNLGLDVPAWISRGLIDYCSPADGMYSDFNAGYAEFGALTRRSECLLYPGLHPWTSYRMRRKHNMTPAMNRALAHTFYNSGANGVSIFNHFVGHLWRPPFYPQALHMLSELGDAQRVAGGARHYVFDPTYADIPWFGNDRHPLAALHAQRVVLDRAGDQPTGVFCFRLYEQMDHVRCATLLVRGEGLTAEDDLEVKLNDMALTPGPFGRPDARAHEQCPGTRWFELCSDAVTSGENQLQLTLTEANPEASEAIVIDEVEIYVQPR